MINAAKVALYKLFNSRARRGPEDEQSSDAMGFFQHLEELRKMLFRCCLAFAVSGAVSLYFYKDIFRLLRHPLDKALELDTAKMIEDGAKHAHPTDPAAGWHAFMELLRTGKLPIDAIPVRDLATDHALTNGLQLLKLMDVFSVLMDVVIFGGVALSFPFILILISNFISPALTDREKRLVRPVLAVAIALFFGGAALAFFWLMPISIQFSLSLARDFGTPLNWTASDYYSFVLMMPLLVGLVFEFPLIIVALQYVEIVSTRKLFELWRHALVGILVVAIIFTPLGDPWSVSLLTGVLFMLYIVSILVGDRLVRMKHRRAAREVEIYEEN